MRPLKPIDMLVLGLAVFFGSFAGSFIYHWMAG